MIAPLIDEIAAENAGKLVCLKLNTDESPGVATEMGIRSIPTVMVFKGECASCPTTLPFITT
jgi:thioredoxin 1